MKYNRIVLLLLITFTCAFTIQAEPTVTIKLNNNYLEHVVCRVAGLIRYNEKYGRIIPICISREPQYFDVLIPLTNLTFTGRYYCYTYKITLLNPEGITTDKKFEKNLYNSLRLEKDGRVSAEKEESFIMPKGQNKKIVKLDDEVSVLVEECSDDEWGKIVKLTN